MTTAVGSEAGGDGFVVPAQPLVAGPEGLPGQWVDAGLSLTFARANSAAWQLCRWMLECSRAAAGTSERVASRPRAGKIVAASLGWTESHAAAQIEFARQVLERLPRLGVAMQVGLLEERKASSIVDLVADLDDEQARAVVEEVLEQAPSLGYTELRRLVGRVAMAIDPQWAERRRAAAVARRRVALRSAPSGAVELCGLDLPEDPAQDAHDRIVALAHAALRRLKRAGISVSVGTVESEVMLTLTGPAGAGMHDNDVVDHVVAALGGPDPDDDPSPDDPSPDDPSPDDDGSGPGEGPSSDDEPSPDDGDPDDGDPDDGDPDDGGPDDGGLAPHGSAPDGPDSGGHPVVAFRPRTVVRMELRGVLGFDRTPGELPGRGPVTHDVALAMAWARTHSRWRIRLYDDQNDLDHVLSVRLPSTGPPPAGGRHRAHVVEIAGHTTDLDVLATEYTDARVRSGEAPDPGVNVIALLSRAARALARERARPPDDHPARSRAEAENRFPSTRLRDWVQSRDHTCRAPGCSADAVGTDCDHTRPVIAGGLTVADDLGALCRRDHLLKHDPDTGWTLRQLRPGHFEWTSPTGRVHSRGPHRHRPLPAPVPRTGPRPRLPEHLPRPGPPGRPRPNRHGHVTDAAADTAWRLHVRPDRTAYAGDDPPF